VDLARRELSRAQVIEKPFEIDYLLESITQRLQAA
jgi:hypothetical protein